MVTKELNNWIEKNWSNFAVEKWIWRKKLTFEMEKNRYHGKKSNSNFSPVKLLIPILAYL